MAISFVLVLYVIIGSSLETDGFVPGFGTRRTLGSSREASWMNSSTRLPVRADKIDSKLLDDFRTSWGEFINPYEVLKVNRAAEQFEIKQSYYKLSRRYHPDGMRYRDILPGSCNNMEDVRNHWERIRMSYEILSDKKSRQRYDRHEALADPGQAVRRAASDAALKGVVGMGKGLLGAGSFAYHQIVKKKSDTVDGVEQKNV